MPSARQNLKELDLSEAWRLTQSATSWFSEEVSDEKCKIQSDRHLTSYKAGSGRKTIS